MSIEATGVIPAIGRSFGAGLTLNGSDAIPNNAGHLDYANTIAVFMNGSDFHVTNTGAIVGAAGGAHLDAANQTLDNSGSISAETTSNTGSDHSNGVGMVGSDSVVTGNNKFTNSGQASDGVQLFGTSNVLVNFGTFTEGVVSVRHQSSGQSRHPLRRCHRTGRRRQR